MATMTAVLTAGLIVAFAGAASALSPTFTATPTTGLTDGQTVHVTYSGFTPNQSAGVAVTSCRNANPGGINDCNTVANDHGTSDQALVFNTSA